MLQIFVSQAYLHGPAIFFLVNFPDSAKLQAFLIVLDNVLVLTSVNPLMATNNEGDMWL